MDAIEEVGGLDTLKEHADLAVDTINAYTRRVKGTGLSYLVSLNYRFAVQISNFFVFLFFSCLFYLLFVL